MNIKQKSILTIVAIRNNCVKWPGFKASPAKIKTTVKKVSPVIKANTAQNCGINQPGCLVYIKHKGPAASSAVNTINNKVARNSFNFVQIGLPGIMK